MISKRRTTAYLAVLSAGALALTACGGDGDNEDPGADRTDQPTDQEGTQPGTITAAVDADYTAYNDQTATGNGTWNAYVHNGTKKNFWKYDPEGGVLPDEEFGTFEKTSDDPLTIEYTIGDDTAWSDGEPIDCDDIMLEWASMSGKTTNAAGESIFSGASTNGYELIEKPDCEPGDKQFTIVYTDPYIDWQSIISGGNVPAHIAAEQGGLTSEELITAIKNDDVAALQPVADFWNTGWAYNPGELPEDRSLIPSSGPYLLDSWVGAQSITLKANPDYYGTPPKTETIVLRILDSDQQVPALQNGEIDLMNPANPTVDTVDQLAALEGQVTTETGANLSWSHVDMQMGAGRPFEKLEVRQAFAKCIPRQLIVDNLIKPTNPDAVTQDLREFFPADEDYESAREEAFPEDMFGEQDLAGAEALLQQAGVTTPLTVRLMHADDPTRNELAALIKSECDKVGFSITDFTPPDWGNRLSDDTGSYDAAMFGWAGSGVIASGQSIYVTAGDQNFYGYSNPEVDELWGQVVTSTEVDAARELLVQMEALLWEDVFNVPLYTNTNLVSYANGIEGVRLNASQNGVTFNMSEWSRSS